MDSDLHSSSPFSYIANTVCRFSPFSSSFPNFLIFSCHCPLCWQDYSRLRPACFERKPGVFLWTRRSVVTETPSLSVFPLTGGFCHHCKHKTSCICSHSNSLVGDLWQELCSASVTIPHAWDSLATRRRLAFLSHPSAVQEGSPMLQPSLRCCKPLSTSCCQVWGSPVTPCTLQETICQSLPVLASRSCPSSKLGLGAWSRLTKRFFIPPVLGWPRQQQARLSGPRGSQIDSHQCHTWSWSPQSCPWTWGWSETEKRTSWEHLEKWMSAKWDSSVLWSNTARAQPLGCHHCPTS